MALTVELVRGELVESLHRVHAAVVEPDGSLAAWSGDPQRQTYMRSAAKPIQALPLVLEGVVEARGVTPAELAVCCGSHGGEPEHLQVVRSLLERVGLDASALECGPHPPMHEASAHGLLRAGGTSEPIHNNCSGKHAGMLALARAKGWPTGGYSRPEHPVQERILAEVERWTGVARHEIVQGVDGCGVPCFGVPLIAMARAFAELAAAADAGDKGPSAVLDAMTAHPFQVAGTDRLCTQLMTELGGRVVAKVGAEGVYCALDRQTGRGIALKVEDGSRRAAEVALMAVLGELQVLGDDQSEAMVRRGEPPVPNTLGRPVAGLRSRGGLHRARARDGGVLGRELGALVRVSGAVATGDEDRQRAALEDALEAADPVAVEEVLVQSHLFVGFPGALNALALWRRVSGRPASGARGDASTTRGRRGEEVCRRVYGDQYPALRANIAHLHPDMDRWMVEEGYGKVLGRPGLGLRNRELCIVALLAVAGVPVQLYSHLRGALEVGATEAMVQETLEAVRDLMTPNDEGRARQVWERVKARRG